MRLVLLFVLAVLSASAQTKPKLYDYVNLESFPVGQYTYESIGGIQRTVREFTTKLQNATQWQFEQNKGPIPPPK